MMQKTLFKTSLSLAITSLLGLGASTASAAPGIALGDYSLMTGDDLVVTLSLQDTGTTHSNSSEVDITGTPTTVSNDKLRADDYHLQIYRIGKNNDGTLGQVYVGGLDSQLSGTRAVTGPDTLTISTTDQLITGLYQIKACQGGLLQLNDDNDDGTTPTQDSAVDCGNDPDASFTSFTVKPATVTGAKIAVLDNFLTRAAQATSGNGSVVPGSVSLTQEMGFSASRNALATVAWLSSLDAADYKFDALSSQDIEAAGSLDNYDVLIVTDRNSVWTDAMRTTLEGFLGDASKGVMFLGAGNLTHGATITDATNISVTAGGSQAVTGLDSNKGGSIDSQNSGAFTVNNADHWIYTGLDLTNGDTFGENSSADKRLVGPLTDGATVTATSGVPATSFNVGTGTYDVIAYANTGDTADENFAVPGVFKSEFGGWVFNTSTLRWAEGLNDLSANFIEPEDTAAQTITKNVIDVFLSGGPVDTDNDGVIDFYDDNPNLNPDDTDGDGVLNGVDNCPAVANADQIDDLDGDGNGDACDTQDDTDTDGDTVLDTTDNCKDDDNLDQADNDQDGVGNACDATPDGDAPEEEEPVEEATSSGGSGSTGLAFLLPLIGLAGFRRKH